MAKRSKLSSLFYGSGKFYLFKQQVFGIVGFTMGAGLGIQGAFSIIKAKHPEFMKTFEKYQLLRRHILQNKGMSDLNKGIVLLKGITSRYNNIG